MHLYQGEHSGLQACCLAFFAGQGSTQLHCKKRPPHTLLRTWRSIIL